MGGILVVGSNFMLDNHPLFDACYSLFITDTATDLNKDFQYSRLHFKDNLVMISDSHSCPREDARH
jgi:hypothetical protein